LLIRFVIKEDFKNTSHSELLETILGQVVSESFALSKDAEINSA